MRTSRGRSMVTDELTDEPPGDICEENLGGRGHSKFQCPNSEQLAHLVCFFLSPISAVRCWRCSGDKNGRGVIVLPLLPSLRSNGHFGIFVGKNGCVSRPTSSLDLFRIWRSSSSSRCSSNQESVKQVLHFSTVL